MSKTTIALEKMVEEVIANRAVAGATQTARQRGNTDKAFMAILKLIAPRIRHFIRQYGLAMHWEDAEQACAIGVHRAIEGYDPAKAQFTTFVNWQLRGELQSLRFRLMTDQRSSAKRVEATTVSLHSVGYNSDGDETSFEATIEDEDALATVESGASCYLAESAMTALVDEYVEHLRTVGIEQLERRPRPKRVSASQAAPSAQPLPKSLPARFRGLDPDDVAKLEQSLARNRDLIERRLFDTATLDQLGSDTGITKERIRQITKRAAKTMGDMTVSNPRFAVMAEPALPAQSKPGAKAASVAGALPQAASLLPQLDQAHNGMTRVVEIAPTPAALAFAAINRSEPAVTLGHGPADLGRARGATFSEANVARL
jgi:RNA polymerase sigma factor (sigma-70 family)